MELYRFWATANHWKCKKMQHKCTQRCLGFENYRIKRDTPKCQFFPVRAQAQGSLCPALRGLGTRRWARGHGGLIHRVFGTFRKLGHFDFSLKMMLTLEEIAFFDTFPKSKIRSKMTENAHSFVRKRCFAMNNWNLALKTAFSFEALLFFYKLLALKGHEILQKIITKMASALKIIG